MSFPIMLASSKSSFVSNHGSTRNKHTENCFDKLSIFLTSTDRTEFKRTYLRRKEGYNSLERKAIKKTLGNGHNFSRILRITICAQGKIETETYSKGRARQNRYLSSRVQPPTHLRRGELQLVSLLSFLIYQISCIGTGKDG